MSTDCRTPTLPGNAAGWCRERNPDCLLSAVEMAKMVAVSLHLGKVKVGESGAGADGLCR